MLREKDEKKRRKEEKKTTTTRKGRPRQEGGCSSQLGGGGGKLMSLWNWLIHLSTQMKWRTLSTRYLHLSRIGRLQ